MAGMSLPASASAPASANPTCVINCVHYDDEGKRHDITLDAISDVIASGNGFVWVGLYDPNDDVLLKLQEEFCLHDLAIERAQRTPAAQGRDLRQFAVRGGDHRADGRRAHPVWRNPCLPRPALPGDGAPRRLAVLRASARTRRARAALLKMGPSYCLPVTDFVVDNYLPIVHRFRDTLDLLEKDIFAENYKRSTVVRLYELKRELNKMRMAVAPLQDVLAQLRRYQGELIPDEVKLYVRDVHDHAVRISDVIDTLREMLGTALSVNLSLVTLAQARRSSGWVRGPHSWRRRR